MIDKTTGIVLRVVPFSRTSHVVTWLTPDRGRLATAVKGAVRPKSAFLGQYDLYYLCDLLYYSRERGGAHILRECSPLDVRSRLRTDWRAVSCASYFCDLASRSCPPGAPCVEFFSLLDSALTSLCSEGASVLTLLKFELEAMEAIGLAPRLEQCIDCNRRLPSGDLRMEFSNSRGGILCGECASGRANGKLTPVSGPMLSALQELQGAPRARERIRDADMPGPELVRTANLLGSFLAFHAHHSLPSRTIALELLEYGGLPRGQLQGNGQH